MRFTGSFGQWLKQRRKALDLTQDELARRVSCAVTTIRRIEADERRPSKQLAALLAQHLHIPAADQQAFVRFARHADGDAAAPQAPPAAAEPSRRLPAPPSPLVGRTAEAEALRALVLRADVRLVTLSGPPGIGKTRLGLHLASTMRDWFADQVYFVALAPAPDPDAVVPAIAEALGFRDAAGQRLDDRLHQWLCGRPALLLLDNFEHLTAGAHVVSELLAAPPLKVVVTSRVALRLPGEHEYAVAPLARPHPGASLPLGALARYPAVDLFVQRARAASPSFALTEANAPDVAAICHRLDGLPLAIELAAARTRLLAPAAILARLNGADDRAALQVLAGGAAASARQQTLRGAIDWSYELLPAREQRLLRRMAVFVGGCTLEAVEAVCSGTPEAGAHTGASVFESVTALLDHSLLQQEIADADQPRFTLLEVIRAYGRERLAAAGEADATDERHAAYYLALAEAAAPELTGPQQVAWHDRLEREHGNMRAALRWALGRRELATAARLCVALWRFWFTRGYLSEGRVWLDQALAQGAALPEPLLIQLLDSAAKLADEQSDFAQAIVLHERVLAMKRARGDTAGIASTLNSLGWIARQQGDIERALALCGESAALYRALGDRRNLSYALNNLGLAAGDGGDYARAEALHRESLALKWELNDKYGIASSLNNLGLVARLQGDYAQARSSYEEGLAVCRETGTPAGIAIFLNNLGSLSISEGDYARATSLCEESLTLRRTIGDRRGIASALHNMALAALGQGEPQRAAVLAKEGLAIYWELGAKSGVAECLDALATVAGAERRPLRAARLYGAAEALAAAIGAAPAPYLRDERARRVAEARARADEAAFAAAWAEGRAMSLPDAIAAALADEVVPPTPGAPPQR